LRVALAQIDPTIGDFAENLRKIRAAVERAREERADVLVLPELALCGYPPLDLVDRPSFVEANRAALEELAGWVPELAIVVGAVLPAPGPRPRPIVNAAVVLEGGRIAHVQAKTLLPTYDVFDEARYFAPAPARELWTFRGRRIGLVICEDAWSGAFWGEPRPYAIDPVADVVELGAELVIVISASPFEHRKIQLREAMLGDAARRHRVPFVFVNLVGGNDDLIFDGASFGVMASGQIAPRLVRFAEDFACVEPFAPAAVPAAPLEDDVELLERALVLGIRDYLHKQSFQRVVIGLSGGIDSAVTAHLAAEALGAENVLGILMPGPFSSDHSVSDAQALAANLGIEARIVPIDAIFGEFVERFRELFGPRPDYGLTQENLQARVRGTLLMAVSNFENRIVLATGNKSELSVGYTTLYGDLVGGVAVIGDVLKRDVYSLARHANRSGERIPWNTIEKPPSAELRPDQVDQDSLPPYEVLDEILCQLLERRVRPEQIDAPGIDPATVRWVVQALDRAEYKRRQAPLVLRVSPKAFGSGRRVPIVQRSGWGL
jgi:NAD+ synthase (glutamine-hydrolysing)